MAERNLSSELSLTTSPTKTRSSASVVALFIRHLLLVSLVVAVVRFAVPDVKERRDDLGRVTLVGSIAVPDCSSCKNSRTEKGHSPRKLTRLPIEVTQDKAFKRKGLPVQLCEFCDGDALERAISTQEKRSPSS